MIELQTFRTLKDAKAEIAKLRGWPSAKAVHLYMPDHPAADRKGNIWVIECGTWVHCCADNIDGMSSRLWDGCSIYLRTDGYIF